MGVDIAMSTQLCGCDEEAKHTCQRHLSEANEAIRRKSPYVGMSEAAMPDVATSAVNTPKVEAESAWTLRRLRSDHPYGHPSFVPITLKEIELHSNKNHDYAKGGPPLGNFERVAAILAHYPNLKLSDRRVVALVYALKQLDAVLWGLNQNIEHKIEGLQTRLQDISVYVKLVMCMNEDQGK